jgi:phage regulator Rha-like protein
MQSNSIKTFLEFVDDEYKISHRIIALETDNNEISVRKLIDKHKESLELFGSLSFEMTPRKDRNSGGDQPKTYYLNEPQATLLLTFMRNNEIVIEFKVRLVKEFYRMRKEIKSKNQTPETAHQTQNETFDLSFYTQQSREMIELTQLINSQNSKTLYYLDNLSKSLNIKSPLELFKIDLSNYYFIPTELGNFINTTAVETNKILEAHGFQIRENGVWHLTEKGRDFGIEVQKGSFLQIKWKIKSII